MRKRYCLLLNNHLSRALKLHSGDNCESQAAFVRRWVIIGILSDLDRSDSQTAQFVLQQLQLAIDEMTDAELSPNARKELLKILTPLLTDAR